MQKQSVDDLSFAAVGDAFITQPVPRDASFQQMIDFLAPSDVRFINLETVLRRDEGFPSAQSGGTWASSPPEVLEDIRDYGFNLIAWANNHTLDYSYGGLQSTKEALKDFVHAGAGENLAEAGATCFLDTPHGRVAFIAATSTFHESWRAGAARPGVHPLRFRTIYKINSEKLETLRAIIASSRINAGHDLKVKEGFAVADPPGTLRVGGHLFVASPEGWEGEETFPHQGDQQRIENAIRKASTHADAILVSIHSHEDGGQKDVPAKFMIDFCRSCIDAGAHAVIGHGPHILRGVEIYKGFPIFYSLGNFIFQNEQVATLPVDFYEQYGLDPSLSVEEALDFRSDGGKKGLAVNPSVWHSVIARWKMKERQLSELSLHPITLGFGKSRQERGIPQLSSNLNPLHEIMRLSKPFGTEFRMQDTALVWKSC